MNCFRIFRPSLDDAPKSPIATSNVTSSTISSDHSTSSSTSTWCRSDTNVSSTSVECSRRSPFSTLHQKPNHLKLFTLDELKAATKNFNHSLIIGEGGFGCVYKGIIRNPDDPNTKIRVAIKQLTKKGWQGHKEWLTEVNVLGVVEHRNLVKLIGYCAEDDERGMQKLLVYELMINRSVRDHLTTRHPQSLSWTARLKVARDAAAGLAYLHEEIEPKIIFRDFKTSNILLDEQWNAKLSDFGMAREGPGEGLTHVTTAAMGTVGYAAPEYLQTGKLTVWSDVWSYGIVLYELITGRPPMDHNLPKTEQKLLEWIKPFIVDFKKFHHILDKRLDIQSSLKSSWELSLVANKCLVRNPKLRPKMTDVVNMVSEIIDSMETEKPSLPMKEYSTFRYTESEESKMGGVHKKKTQDKIQGNAGNFTGLMKRKW